LSRCAIFSATRAHFAPRRDLWPWTVFAIGAGGLLGTAVVWEARRRAAAGEARWELVPLARAELDVTDAEAVRTAFATHRPEAVLHGAAWTAVDAAESQPEAAARVNVAGTRHVAGAAADHDALLAYLSTDFVFDGRARRPYRPDDPPNPLGVYARTKLQGEELTRAATDRHLILRTGGLYGAGGRDFVDAILERAGGGEGLRVVDDQTVAPTWSRNLAAAALDLLDDGATGTWHVQDRGALTWHAFARRILELAGPPDALRELEAVSSEAYGAPAPRPAWSVLDCSATEERLGRPMQSCEEALAHYLRESGEAAG